MLRLSSYSFDDSIVARAVERRKNEYQNLKPDFLKLAIARLLGIRNRNLLKDPSNAELLVWLRVLSIATGAGPEPLLDADLSRLPYLGAALKDHMDLEELTGHNPAVEDVFQNDEPLDRLSDAAVVFPYRRDRSNSKSSKPSYSITFLKPPKSAVSNTRRLGAQHCSNTLFDLLSTQDQAGSEWDKRD